jgi:hypothetical protein
MTASLLCSLDELLYTNYSSAILYRRLCFSRIDGFGNHQGCSGNRRLITGGGTFPNQQGALMPAAALLLLLVAVL